MAIDRAPWTALVDDDGSNLTGSIWNKAAIKTVLLDPTDAFVGNGGTWTAYTPVWSGQDGLGPTPGNAIIEGRYMQIGKWITFAIVLISGTTTTYGTSSLWRITLPVAPRTNAGILHPQQMNFPAAIIQGNGATSSGWTAYLLAHGSTNLYASNPAGGLWGPTVPFTWGTNGLFSVRGNYEVP